MPEVPSMVRSLTEIWRFLKFEQNVAPIIFASVFDVKDARDVRESQGLMVSFKFKKNLTFGKKRRLR